MSQVLTNAGFEVEGVNEAGETFYRKELADGRVVICGNNDEGGRWGADCYASPADAEDGRNRATLAGSHASPEELVAALSAAGLI